MNLIIVGATGRVGSALRRQIDSRRDLLLRSTGVDLHVVGLINSRFEQRNGEGGCGAELSDPRPEWPVLVEQFRAMPGPRVIVDCTASQEVANLYGRFLEGGSAVVTANKIAGAGPLEQYLRLHAVSRDCRLPLLAETTVGAALPILRSIESLRETGDEIREFDAVLSGTLSFVLSRLSAGIAFSEAVREAIVRGFTEPDPCIDLGGEDVAKKVVILARACGQSIERGDVSLEALLPPGLTFDGDSDRFVSAVAAMDEDLAWRVARSVHRGERLIYLARFHDGHARVGLASVPAASPLAVTRGSENVVVCRTERYGETPLTIAGPGAGPEVTAAGVLADILRAAVEMRYFPGAHSVE